MSKVADEEQTCMQLLIGGVQGMRKAAAESADEPVWKLQVATSEAMVHSYASSLANVAIYAELHGYVALMRIFNPGELADFPASSDRDPQISTGNLFAKVVGMSQLLAMPFSSAPSTADHPAEIPDSPLDPTQVTSQKSSSQESHQHVSSAGVWDLSSWPPRAGDLNDWPSRSMPESRLPAHHGSSRLGLMLKSIPEALYPGLHSPDEASETDPSQLSRFFHHHRSPPASHQPPDDRSSSPADADDTEPVKSEGAGASVPEIHRPVPVRLKLSELNKRIPGEIRRSSRKHMPQRKHVKQPLQSSKNAHVAIHHPTASVSRTQSPPIPPAAPTQRLPKLGSKNSSASSPALLPNLPNHSRVSQRHNQSDKGSRHRGPSKRSTSPQHQSQHDRQLLEHTGSPGMQRPHLRPLEAVLYLDLDAWIQIDQHAHTSLETFLPPTAHISLQSTSDLCSCVFMARSSAWTQRFLARWAELGKKGCCPEHPYDQLGLHATLLEYALAGSGLNEHAARCLPVPSAADRTSSDSLGLPLGAETSPATTQTEPASNAEPEVSDKGGSLAVGIAPIHSEALSATAAGLRAATQQLMARVHEPWLPSMPSLHLLGASLQQPSDADPVADTNAAHMGLTGDQLDALMTDEHGHSTTATSKPHTGAADPNSTAADCSDDPNIEGPDCKQLWQQTLLARLRAVFEELLTWLSAPLVMHSAPGPLDTEMARVHPAATQENASQGHPTHQGDPPASPALPPTISAQAGTPTQVSPTATPNGPSDPTDDSHPDQQQAPWLLSSIWQVAKSHIPLLRANRGSPFRLHADSNVSVSVGLGGGIIMTHLADNYTWNTLGSLKPMAVGSAAQASLAMPSLPLLQDHSPTPAPATFSSTHPQPAANQALHASHMVTVTSQASLLPSKPSCLGTELPRPCSPDRSTLPQTQSPSPSLSPPLSQHLLFCKKTTMSTHCSLWRAMMKHRLLHQQPASCCHQDPLMHCHPLQHIEPTQSTPCCCQTSLAVLVCCRLLQPPLLQRSSQDPWHQPQVMYSSSGTSHDSRIRTS